MINNVNSVNSEHLNLVQTAEVESTTKVDEKKELEKKVYEQADVKDTIELSEKGKGLSESAFRSMQDAMSANKRTLLDSFVNSTNSIYKSGISVRESASLIDAYNTSRYLAKNTYKMYYDKQDTSEIEDLKNQISQLEDVIKEAESEENEK